ncbi:DUF2513 domain-containing protein [Pseudomonas sp. PM2]|mgnify:FL=1|uniref:hypothetical protein n=1 Tax=Pseudomonas sp. PM2 TaxID=215172 RepID=UPI003FA1A653
MTTSNIKRFDELTGQLFGVLYESFPLPRNLEFEHFPAEDKKFFVASVDWLSRAGYLSFMFLYPNQGYTEVVLTSKGLEVLKALPESLKSGPSLGDQLVDASKTGAKSLLGDIAGQALSIGVKIATSHLGLPG